MSSIEDRLKKLEQVILREIKTIAQSVPIGISAEVGDFLRSPDDKKGLVKSKKTGNLYYNEPNTTDQLRTLYGNIQRSTLVKGVGNYNKVEFKNGHFIIEFGYTPSTKVRSGNRMITLEYAEKHETGKWGGRPRPFLEPGFNQFFKNPEGWEYFRQEMEDMIYDELKRVF